MWKLNAPGDDGLLSSSNPVSEAKMNGNRSSGCLSYFLGVKNAVLVPLRVFSFKKSSVVAFMVPLRVEIW